MVYGNIESGGRLGPFQDISSICRAAIVSGVGTNEAPFYVTFTIVEPVAEYQDPGGGRVVFDKWALATDPVLHPATWYCSGRFLLQQTQQHPRCRMEGNLH